MFHLRYLLLSCVLACTAQLPVAAGTAGFAESVQAGPVRLVKVGEGAYRWMLFHVYDGAFYLEPAAAVDAPLADVAKRLELAYAVQLDADAFRRSADSMLQRNVDGATLAALRERLDRLNAAYRPVRKGDRYALTYLPGTGTTLCLNGMPLVTIEGADFAAAYFAIWLGANPAKASFRRALLGQ
jgi:hypothetical protein